MKNIILCLIVQVLLINCAWKTLLPSANRGKLIDVTPRCVAQEYCEVVFAWSVGDIIAVDMMNHNIYSYHNSIHPAGFNQPITSVAYSGDAGFIFVSASNGAIYSQSLSSASAGSSANNWQSYLVPGLTTGAIELITIPDTESTDLLLITSNGTVIEANPSYSLSTVLSKTTAANMVATVSLAVDLTTKDGTYLSGIWTAYAGGQVTYTSLIDSTFKSWNTTTSTPIQILPYRINGTVWIIIGFSAGTASNSAGWFRIWDMATLLTNTSWAVNSPTAMTILPDLQLNDWLVIAGGGKIIKYYLPRIAWDLQFVVLSQQNLLHSTGQIISLQTSWTKIENDVTGETQVVPVLLAVSDLGAVSALVTGSATWQVLADPADLNDLNATISSATLVLSTFSSFTEPVYNVLLVLDDGEVLIQDDISSEFIIGSLSQSSDYFVKKQDDYENGITSRRIAGAESNQVGTISFTEMCNLINMNAEVYVQLQSTSTNEAVEFRVVGYEVDSDPNKCYTQNVILLPSTTNSTGAAGMRFNFWTPQEIRSGFDTLLDYIDVGLDIVDFVWTVTKFFL